MWFQYDKSGDGGRRWWKNWPNRQSHDVNKNNQDGLWDGDIRKFSDHPFNGYFKDIREIANRAIPSSTSIHPSNVNTPRIDKTLAVTPRTAITLDKVQRYLTQTESFEPNLDSPKTVDTFRYPPPSNSRALLSLKSEQDYAVPKKSGGCTLAERFLVGTSMYLAIAVLIMLIVIGVMVASLKDINKSIENINVVSILIEAK